MKQIVCSVYDSAVGQYLTPFFTRSKLEALRSFKAAANQQDHDFNNFSTDYTLFALGEFDAGTGTFEAYTANERLSSAHELIDREPVPDGQMSLVEPT